MEYCIDIEYVQVEIVIFLIVGRGFYFIQAALFTFRPCT